MSNIQIETGPIALNLFNNDLKNCKSITCNNGIFVSSQPCFSANRTLTQQTTTANVLTPLVFDTVSFNINNCVSYNNVTGEITILKGGLYSIYAQVLWQANTTGTRLIEFNFPNASTQRQAVNINPSQNTTPMYSSTSMNYKFADNETFQVRVLRSPAGTLNIVASVMSCIYISRIC